jgi:hypothetical protein
MSWVLLEQTVIVIDFPLQVVVTPTHLAICMEYAAGGELFDRICNAGRFSEDEVRIGEFVRWPFHFRRILTLRRFLC